MPTPVATKRPTPVAITKNPNGAYVIELTAKEQAVMDGVEATYGQGTFGDMIANWLEAQEKTAAAQERQLFEQQFKGLTSAKQAQVKSILGGSS